MISFISRLFRRFKAFRHIDLQDESSRVEFHLGVEFHLEPGSKILIGNGCFKVGYAFETSAPYSTYSRTVISLKRNAVLVVNGDTMIAPGSCIKLQENAYLEFNEGSFFGHNLLIMCARRVTFGKHFRSSWNVTFMDHDGHGLISRTGRHFKPLYRPLEIGNNVAVQMNVQIVRGVSIGDNSIISAGTVVRNDIEKETHVYAIPELRIKKRKSLAQLPKLFNSRGSHVHN